MIFSELMTQLESKNIPFELPSERFLDEIEKEKHQLDLLYNIIEDKSGELNIEELTGELLKLDDSNKSKNTKLLFRDLFDSRVRAIQKERLELPEESEQEANKKIEQLNKLSNVHKTIIKPLQVSLFEKMSQNKSYDIHLSSSKDISKVVKDRVFEIGKLLSTERCFSSDLFYGFAGRPKVLNKSAIQSLTDETKDALNNYINEFDVSPLEFKEILKGDQLEEFQKNQLRSGLKAVVEDKSFPDGLRASILLTSLEGSITDREVAEYLSNHLSGFMTPSVATMLLDKVQQLDGKKSDKVFGNLTASELRDNIIGFYAESLSSLATLSTKTVGSLDEFNTLGEKLKQMGYSRDKINKIARSLKKSPPSLIQKDIKAPDSSIRPATLNTVRESFKDVSKEIKQMQAEMNFSTDIKLNSWGKFSKGKAATIDKFRQNIGLKQKKKPFIHDHPEFFDTRFDSRLGEKDGSMLDSNIKRVVFKNSSGKPFCIAESDHTFTRSYHVRLDPKAKCTKEIANLMVLQYMKMNPKIKNLEIRPPKSASPKDAEMFIKLLVQASIKQGFKPDEIKVKHSDSVTKQEAEKYKKEAIASFKSDTPDASIGAPSDDESKNKASSGMSKVLKMR